MPTAVAEGVITPTAGSQARRSVEAKADTSRHAGKPDAGEQVQTSSRARSNPRGSNANREAGRAKLSRVASDFAAGNYTSREQSVVTDEGTSDEGREHRPTSDVTDSPSLAPTPKAEPKESAKPATEKREASKPSKEPTAAEKAAADEKAKKLVLAKRSLALDGWTPERIAKFDEETILEMGSHRAKNQADINREYARLRNAATSPTGARAADGKFAPASETPAAAADESTDAGKDKAKEADAQVAESDPDVAAFLDASREELGEPGYKALKQLAKHFESRLAAKGQTDNAVQTEMLYSRGYDLVEEMYPEQLSANENAFGEVVENFKVLVASGRYRNGQISKIWRDAAMLHFGAPDSVRKAQRSALNRQKAADDGPVDPGRGDTGDSTDAPISNRRDQLRLAGKLMAESKTGDLTELSQVFNNRISGRR